MLFGSIFVWQVFTWSSLMWGQTCSTSGEFLWSFYINFYIRAPRWAHSSFDCQKFSSFLEIFRPLSDYLGNSVKLKFWEFCFSNFSFWVFKWNFMGSRSKLIKLGNSYCNIGAQTPDDPRLAWVWARSLVLGFWRFAHAHWRLSIV